MMYTSITGIDRKFSEAQLKDLERGECTECPARALLRSSTD